VLLAAHDESHRILELYLKKLLVFDGTELYLKNIVHPDSGAPAANDLKELRIPFRKDRLIIYSTENIRSAIKTEYKDAFILVGQRVFILPKNLVKEKDAWFFEDLLDFVSAQNYQPNARIEIEVSGVPDIPENAVAHVQFEINAVKLRNGMKVGQARISYRCEAGQSIKQGNIDIVLHVIVAAAVPKSLIRSGETLNEEMLVERNIDISQYNDDIMISGAPITSFTAIYDLYPGEPVFLKKISRTLYVRSGDKISITFKKKNLTVQLRGRAFNSGGLDEKISIRPDGTERKFQGIITGEKEVTVELQ
jgi:flagella basal body P-ring formation protein FlgA